MTNLETVCEAFKVNRQKRPAQTAWQGKKQREAKARAAMANGLFDPGAEQDWYFPKWKGAEIQKEV